MYYKNQEKVQCSDIKQPIAKLVYTTGYKSPDKGTFQSLLLLSGHLHHQLSLIGIASLSQFK